MFISQHRPLRIAVSMGGFGGRKAMGAFCMAIFRALFVPIHFVAFVACDRNTEMQGLMDAAEKVVSSNADSALRILDSIPASKIRGKEARARYALLKSIVLDKNYIDRVH